MNQNKLGGFAEDLTAIDGTEEDFNAFNYCLACDYCDAVIGEDFDGLGEDLNDGVAWHYIMSDVCYWLNYDGEIGKNLEEEFPKLYNGTVITYNNRTFIEACRHHGWHKLADDLSSIKKIRRKK